MKIPFKSLIHIRNPLISDYCKSLKIKGMSNDKELYKNQYFCLVVFTLNQLRNPSGEFKYYFETLPKSFEEFPIFYKDTDLETIKNSLLENSILMYKNTFVKLFNQIKEANIADNLKLSDIIQAFLSVSSRNFSVLKINTEQFFNILIPYADFGNYSPFPNTLWDGYLNDEDDFFILNSKVDINKGDQIYIGYGDDDNHKLLIDYGFTIKNNKFNEICNDFKFKHNNRYYYTSLDSQDSNQLIKN